MTDITPVTNRPQVAILDFGSQYSHLIARRVRELHVFCELYSCLVTVEELSKHDLTGIILSGGPNSVYEEGAPHVRPEVWKFIEDKKLPVLGICYGMQELAYTFGGEVSRGVRREYGKAMVKTHKEAAGNSLGFLNGLMEEDFQVWMSHGDKLTKTPVGFVDIAYTANSEHAAIANVEKKYFGIQFHPEVTHSPLGKKLLSNFVVDICKSPTDWDMRNIADVFIQEVREKVGPHGHVIGAVSGGVDSSVAAALLHRAIGDRFHAVLIDNGLLRLGEAEEVVNRLQRHLGINLHCINAEDRFLAALKGVEEPETKRKRIGNLFIDLFQEEAARINHPVDFLLQGTLYPDVIESISYKGPSATIKTHHNVGGLPDTMHLKLIEPLRELFKDEVRELGMVLGIEEESVWRHPFPGPGLAIRVLGEVTKEGLDIVRQADAIFLEELRKHGHYRSTGQAFCVLLPVKSVGVMGDGRTYEKVIAIRAVSTSDFMTADWYHMPHELLAIMSSRIINEVRGVNRVVYDISSKPPATIEWE
ncbi:GMP synthase [Achlya hypogyna]|uniref:GMP synthase [glutamine-hydrolyzing] n=1 Tax=Achlya hypogyna TaxID=1202772 RepID=A0A1V9YGJ4_ACHHY|nr:GMP synthase [Achlya hypogyna]